MTTPSPHRNTKYACHACFSNRTSDARTKANFCSGRSESSSSTAQGGEGAPLYCECNQWVMIFVTVVILATEHNGGDNGNGKDGAGSDSAHMHSRRRNRRLKDRECICARRQAMREILFAHSHTLLHKSMHMIAFATATRTRHLNADTIEPTHAPQHSLPRCPHVLQRICVRGLASL